MILAGEEGFDPSQLIMLVNALHTSLLSLDKKKAIPLVEPVESTPAKPFFLKATSTPSVLSVTEKASQFTPVLVLQAKSVPESDITQIGGMTRSGRVH